MTKFQTANNAAMDDARPVLRPGWRPLNIILMIIGFIVFWPLGLAMLAYILWGHKMGDFKADMKRQFASFDSWSSGYCSNNVKASASMRSTGNAAFDAYRAEALARLEEERRQIEEMRREFDEYMESLRMARDKEEFDRFMADRASKKAGPGDQTVINT